MVSATTRNRPWPDSKLKYGFRTASRGKTDRTYKTWQQMRQRCDNSKSTGYELYGGRGIYYTPRWAKFENFLEDMGERPEGLSLDRLDNHGPYCKENCRWATSVEQNRNRRNVKMFRFQGREQTVAEWSRELGMCAETLRQRLKRGWTVEIAFTR